MHLLKQGIYIGKSVAFCAKNVVKEKHPVNYYFYSGVKTVKKGVKLSIPCGNQVAAIVSDFSTVSTQALLLEKFYETMDITQPLR